MVGTLGERSRSSLDRATTPGSMTGSSALAAPASNASALTGASACPGSSPAASSTKTGVGTRSTPLSMSKDSVGRSRAIRSWGTSDDGGRAAAGGRSTLGFGATVLVRCRVEPSTRGTTPSPPVERPVNLLLRRSPAALSHVAADFGRGPHRTPMIASQRFSGGVRQGGCTNLSAMR